MNLEELEDATLGGIRSFFNYFSDERNLREGERRGDGLTSVRYEGDGELERSNEPCERSNFAPRFDDSGGVGGYGDDDDDDDDDGDERESDDSCDRYISGESDVVLVMDQKTPERGKKDRRGNEAKDEEKPKKEYFNVYVSFYTPEMMMAIKPMEKIDADGSRGSCSSFFKTLLLNAMITLYNLFFVPFAKKVVEISNAVTIHFTKDPENPDCRFSHVELSTESKTYVAKYGTPCFSIEQKFYSESASCLVIILNRDDYSSVVEECERAVKLPCSFNYFGSFWNFAVGERIREFFIGSKVYRKKDAYFCSEFVSEALSATSEFKEYFTENGELSSPAMTSPIKLWSILERKSWKSPTVVARCCSRKKRTVDYGKKRKQFIT